MANIFRKNMYLCFSKIKCLPTTLSPPPTNDEDGEDDDGGGDNDDILKSYNSLFTSNSDQDLLTSSSDFSEEPENTDIAPDFSSIFASRRFFFSAPGTSNSIVDSPEMARAPEVVSGGMAIQTYSPDPYADFRTSMEEMVEAKGLKDVRGDWKFLHELLLCYLNLNPKHTHKYIIGAFTDLIVTLMSSSAATASQIGRKSDGHHRHCRSSSEPPLVL